MKISKAELRILVRKFKKLVETDVNGVTSTDARITVGDWLQEVGQIEAAQDFERLVYNYQVSPKIVKLQEEHNQY